MFEFHKDRQRYFEIQVMNSCDSILPFIEQYFTLPAGAHILEGGAGEGGVLKAFTDRGYFATGVEIEERRVKTGERFLATEVKEGKVQFIKGDIFDFLARPPARLYHLIIFKDVIEHLPQKELLFFQLRKFLHPDGAVFFGFPPWKMPFGGHQQMCSHRLISRCPWLHLLPRFVYRQLLILYKQPVPALMAIYDTRISIEGFKKLVKKTGYTVVGKKHFLIAPIYEYKFGWKQREQFPLIKGVPYARDFVTTAVYYLVRPSAEM